MVAPFDEGDFVPRFVAVGQRLNPGGRRPLAVEYDPTSELLEVARLRMAFQFDAISPRNRGSARHHEIRELAVVGKQHETGGMIVEPADGINALPDAAQEGNNRGPPFGITKRRDVTRGFVQEQVDATGAARQQLAAHLDVVALGISLGAKLRDRAPVDAYQAPDDQLLGLAARGDARPSDDFLKALLHGRQKSEDRSQESEVRIAVSCQ